MKRNLRNCASTSTPSKSMRQTKAEHQCNCLAMVLIRMRCPNESGLITFDHWNEWRLFRSSSLPTIKMIIDAFSDECSR